MDNELLVLHAGRPGCLSGRLGETLGAALEGVPHRFPREGESLENRRLLFAFPCRGTGST